MPAPFPSQYELKLAGWSLLCSQLIWVLLGLGFAIFDPGRLDVDLYNVESVEDVEKLHDFMSSQDIRVLTELSAALSWISFPLYLLAIYGIKKIYLSLFVDTKMEIWIYVLEKAYLLSLVIVCIIGPAISLVAVSFEWSYHIYSHENFLTPIGYYVQLYALQLSFELYDSVCIADGLFLCLIMVIPQYRYFTTDRKFDIMKQHGLAKKIYHALLICLAISIGISYLISLFRFAEHGFFSLTGGAGWIPIYGFIVKAVVGIRLIRFATSSQYDEFKKVFGDKKDSNDNDNILSNQSGGNADYDMNTLNNTNDNDDEML